MFYWLVKALFWPFGRFYLGLRRSGGFPRWGGVLVVANHASWLDPTVLGSACPRPVRFLITRRVHDRAGQTWFYRWMRTIPVMDKGEADHGAIRRAVRALRAGEVVGVFPEGIGLDPAGGSRPARSGAALIASVSKAPVVPAAISGTHASMPKGSRWPRPGRVRVVFGEPFRIDQPDGEPRRSSRQGAADEMMRRIERLRRQNR